VQGKQVKILHRRTLTQQLIAFLWTHSHTLWKDRCAVAHAPAEDSPDNSSARSRQAARQRVEMAYAHAPLMLAHDRRVLDVPFEERLAWVNTISPSSIKASATLVLKYTPVIKTYATLSPTQPWQPPPRPLQPSPRQKRAQLVPTCPPSHSAALSERANQDSHDLRRHSPVLSRL
jgi:hypothetical protein